MHANSACKYSFDPEKYALIMLSLTAHIKDSAKEKDFNSKIAPTGLRAVKRVEVKEKGTDHASLPEEPGVTPVGCKADLTSRELRLTFRFVSAYVCNPVKSRGAIEVASKEVSDKYGESFKSDVK